MSGDSPWHLSPLLCLLDPWGLKDPSCQGARGHRVPQKHQADPVPQHHQGLLSPLGNHLCLKLQGLLGALDLRGALWGPRSLWLHPLQGDLSCLGVQQLQMGLSPPFHQCLPWAPGCLGLLEALGLQPPLAHPSHLQRLADQLLQAVLECPLIHWDLGDPEDLELHGDPWTRRLRPPLSLREGLAAPVVQEGLSPPQSL